MDRDPPPLSDADQGDLARLVSVHDADLLGLVWEVLTVRLLSDEEFTALAAALAAEERDASEAERLAGVLVRLTVSHWEADMPQRPLRAPLALADRQRVIALAQDHALELLPVAHVLNLRWLADSEVAGLGEMLDGVFFDSLDDASEPSPQGAEASRLRALIEEQRHSFWA